MTEFAALIDNTPQEHIWLAAIAATFLLILGVYLASPDAQPGRQALARHWARARHRWSLTYGYKGRHHVVKA